jgi:hypothetical protein
LDTVTLTTAEVVWLPAASRALRADRVRSVGRAGGVTS